MIIFFYFSIEHLRGSRRHKIYHNIKIDHERDQAESITSWSDESDGGGGGGGGGRHRSHRHRHRRPPIMGGHHLGKHVIVCELSFFFFFFGEILFSNFGELFNIFRHAQLEDILSYSSSYLTIFTDNFYFSSILPHTKIWN